MAIGQSSIMRNSPFGLFGGHIDKSDKLKEVWCTAASIHTLSWVYQFLGTEI